MRRTRPSRAPWLPVLALLWAAPVAGQGGAGPVEPAGPAEAGAIVDSTGSAVSPADGATGSGPSIRDDVALGSRLVLGGLSAPARWSPGDWLVIPAATGVLAVVAGVDDEVAAFARSRQDGVGGEVLAVIEPLGQEYSWAVLGGLYVGGLALGRPGLRRAAVEATASSFLAGVVTQTLKLAVGRARPRQDLGPYAFDAFSGDESFPSGHVTQAFAVASALAAGSESMVVDILAYGLAAGVGAARIHDDGHFLTDVLAGAAIGTVVGHGVVALSRDAGPEGGRSRLYVGLAAAGIGVGLRVPAP